MARKRIRIGVAGLGRIGWGYHCRAIAAHEQFELVAVQDLLPERLAEAKETYGVAGYADLAQLLAEAKPEAMVIATPTHLHLPMSVEALRAGSHVLLEKPMASDAKEAAAIARAAKRYDRLLTVYQPLRASAYFQHLRAILTSGRLGRVYHVRIGVFSYGRRNDWQSLRKYGGGMLSNYGAHSLDQLLQLIGYDIKEVFSNLRVVASLGDAEDVLKVVVTTRSGGLGELDVNQASTIRPFSFEAWGTQGALSVQGYQEQIKLTYFTPDQLVPKTLDKSLASANRRYPSDDVAFVEETLPVDQSLAVDFYDNFAAAIRKGKPLFVKPEEPLAVMKLIDRCREQSKILRTR
jgi:scyllo-inositol 2-dehydrogenase (NADP+)